MLGGNPVMEQHIILEALEIFLVASYYGQRRQTTHSKGPL